MTISYKDQKLFLFYKAVNMFISAMMQLNQFWSQPLVAIQETEMFGTSVLASFFNPWNILLDSSKSCFNLLMSEIKVILKNDYDCY